MLPENLLKQRLASGQTPIGHMVMEFATRGLPHMLQHAGVDFAVIDTEHTSFNVTQLADLLAWFKAVPVTAFVRIPQIDYHFVARTLDLGAMGIMAPNVRSGEQARRLVEATKYPPVGVRGVTVGGATTNYGTIDTRQYLEHMNRHTSVICQIESPDGLENIDAIASTPGVDVLWVGHFDLSVTMGIPGQFDDPRFVEALRCVVEAARRHGIAAGIQPRSADQAAPWIDMGFNVLSFAADIFVYSAALQAGVTALRQRASAPA